MHIIYYFFVVNNTQQPTHNIQQTTPMNAEQPSNGVNLMELANRFGQYFIENIASISIVVVVLIGAMVEIPAAALMLPSLLKVFDFVSIGTNDLIQYTLAIDRADETVAHLYNPWHPAVLQLIARTIATANAAGKEVSVCGEMAGDVDFTDVLLGMGLRSFSMHPSQISAVKQRVLRSDAKRWQSQLELVLHDDDPKAACLQAQREIAQAPNDRRTA